SRGEQRQGHLDESERCQHVDREHALEPRERQLVERYERARPELRGIVNEEIEATEALRRCGEALAMLRVSDVAGDRQDAATAVADATRESLEVVGAARGQDEVVVLAGQKRG